MGWIMPPAKILPDGFGKDCETDCRDSIELRFARPAPRVVITSGSDPTLRSAARTNGFTFQSRNQHLSPDLVCVHSAVGRQQQLVDRLAVRAEARGPNAYSNPSASAIDAILEFFHRTLKPQGEFTHFNGANLHQRNELITGVAAQEVLRPKLMRQQIPDSP